MRAKSGLIGLILGIALLIQGCGGGGGGTTITTGGSAPTATTTANTEAHIGGFGPSLVGQSFTTFGPNSRSSGPPPPSGPFYDSRLGLWVVVSISASTFTETFYSDQAQADPAGSATYTLDIATQTLSGTITITQGTYAGLSGTYTETLNSKGFTGNYNLTLPNGTTVTCQFNVTKGSGGIPAGTATETVTQTSGYSETSTFTYNSNGTMKVTASDSNGYKSTFNFAADMSGSGTISGPDPGLPATIKWNNVGTGTVTFADGTSVTFTNWQFRKAPAK